MKKIVPIVLLVIAVMAVLGIKNKKQEAATGTECRDDVCVPHFPEEKTQPNAAPAEPAAQEKRLPKLLDLGADKCIPCKAMAPILEELKVTFTGRLNVEFIDVWENKDAGRKYDIRIIPTQIFYSADGNELFRHEGFFSREDMLAKWKELGFDFSADH